MLVGDWELLSQLVSFIVVLGSLLIESTYHLFPISMIIAPEKGQYERKSDVVQLKDQNNRSVDSSSGERTEQEHT